MEDNKNLNEKDLVKNIPNGNFEELSKQIEELQDDEDGKLKGGFVTIDNEYDDDKDSDKSDRNCNMIFCSCG